jgi:Leucine rich repeat
MESRTPNAMIADPEAARSSSSASSTTSNHAALDRKDGKFAQLCSSLTATRLALALSLLTLLIGLTLFIFTTQKNANAPPGAKAGPAVPESLVLDRNETEAYWLRLQSEVLLPQEVVLPDSPVWKALQWMVLNDPLRPVPAGWQATQRYAMVALFYHWTGDSGWNLLEDDGWIQKPYYSSTKKHECEWTGVECNSDKHVTSLLLDSEQTTFVLNGQIPSELGLLTSLDTLDLTGQMLKGILPPELAALGSSLKWLHVAFNRLTRLDAELLGQLTSLEILHLNNNLLRGTLPSTMINLGQLQVLDVSQNDDLTGNVFGMMDAWPNLIELEVTNTRIGGSLPDQIGDLSSLEILSLGSSLVRFFVASLRFAPSVDSFAK